MPVDTSQDAGLAGREGPSPAGSDPRPGRQRLRGREPAAVADRGASGRLRHDDPQAGLAARGPARRPRPDGGPADRLEPRRPARPTAPADRSSTASPTGPTRSRPTASSSTGPISISSPGCSPGWSRGRSPASSTPAAPRNTATTPPAPTERDPTEPNSDYAVSKVAAANLIYFYGKRKNFPCANLRLYSVYGPLEDSARLIPNLIRHGLEGDLSRRSSTRRSRATSSSSTT